MEITHMSAYAQIVERLGKEGGASPLAILSDMQRPWVSDMRQLFKDDCVSAQIPVPSEDELNSIIQTLWDTYPR